MNENESSGVLVLGPFRSGTSLACRILSRLGVDFGPEGALLEADLFNPRGYLQRADVRRANTRFIRSAGCPVFWPDHPERLARAGDLYVLDRMDLEWRSGTAVWGLKDPRFCATLLSWFEAGHFSPGRTRIVLVTRNPEDSARSLYAMPELSRQLHPRTLASAKKTVDRYAEFAAWHAQHLGLPVLALPFEDLLAQPAVLVGKLAEFVGNQSGAEIASAIDVVG
ncbi:MAG: sulfotransferase [Rhodocyclaceae bacterium]|jgi:hypothetical protein